MPRHEFTKKTMRQALERAGDGDMGAALCEAVGAVYGHPRGHRCNYPLSNGVEFDHYPMVAGDEGSDTLDNCVAVCKTCHRWKTSHYDIPVLAKGKRISDAHYGIEVAPPRRMQGRGFTKRPPQRKASTPLTKTVTRITR